VQSECHVVFVMNTVKMSCCKWSKQHVLLFNNHLFARSSKVSWDQSLSPWSKDLTTRLNAHSTGTLELTVLYYRKRLLTADNLCRDYIM